LGFRWRPYDTRTGSSPIPIFRGLQQEYDTSKPDATTYMMTAGARDGKRLAATKTHKIHIPADSHIKGFWSLIAYRLRSRTFIN